METAGIIAEYNPFHNGHLFLQQQASQLAAATAAVLSGYFVQRGEPALFSPFLRTQAALQGGLDLAVSLPTAMSLAPAELFARAGVLALARLGVTRLVFGCESGDAHSFRQAAQTVRAAERSPLFSKLFQEGMGYPKARSEAVGMLYGSIAERNLGPGVVEFVMDDERFARHAGETPLVNGEPLRVPTVPASEAEPVDLVILAIKAPGMAAALKTMECLVGPRTAIASLVNGVTSEESVAERFGWGRTVLSVAQGMDAVFIGDEMTYAHPGEVRFGAAPGTGPGVVDEVADLYERAGIPHVVEADIRRRMWVKLMLNVGINQTCMVYGGTYGTASEPGGEQQRCFVAAMREALAVARAEGVDVTEEDLERAARNAFEGGWRRMKLYFMIGLPTETDEDVVGIARMAERVLEIGREVVGRGVRSGVSVSISVAVLVPKAYTPFQWCGQLAPDEVRRRQRLLLSEIRDRAIRVSYHDADVSLVEGALSRMGRAGFALVRRAWELGCTFDAWTSEFDVSRWERAAADCGLDLADVACEDFPLTARLPWDHTSPGVDAGFLQREWRRAVEGVTTPDCTRATCAGCGVCPTLGVRNVIQGVRS